MIISISVSIIGFMSTSRLLKLVFRDFFFPRKIQIFWSSILMTLVLILLFYFFNRPFLLWIGLVLLSVFLLLLPYLIRQTLEKRTKDLMIPFIDEIVLNIQQGRSLRGSIEQGLKKQNGFFRSQIHELYNSILFPASNTQFKSPFLKKICHELTQIDRSQSRCLEQIKMLRRQLRIQENFRRKSRQVSQQSRTQALILTVFQMLLTLFVISKFGWSENFELIITSTFLFLLGLILIFWIGRFSSWKV